MPNCVYFLEQRQHALRVLEVQRSGGLIAEQELWIFDDGSCDRHSLLLAGEFPGETVLLSESPTAESTSSVLSGFLLMFDTTSMFSATVEFGTRL